MKTIETAVAFLCDGDRLYGIIHQPVEVHRRGILILGGRLGGHRQAVLFARAWAETGIPVMRFDFRGTGNSEGKPGAIEETYKDIRAAINSFMSNVASLEEVVIWGLCRGASTALLYADSDPRVSGLVLANPEMPTESAAPSAYIHYYSSRITNVNFWAKIVRREFDYVNAARSFFARFATALKISDSEDVADSFIPLEDCMANALKNFKGNVFVILSGEDINAYIFEDAARHWQEAGSIRTVTLRKLPGVDHIFSRREWHDEVASRTVEWVRAW